MKIRLGVLSARERFLDDGTWPIENFAEAAVAMNDNAEIVLGAVVTRKGQMGAWWP